MDVRPTEVLDDGPPPERELWLWLVVLFVLAVAGSVAAWLITRTEDGTAGSATRKLTPSAPRTTTVAITTKAAPAPAALPVVPNVIGEDEKTAKRELHDAGFHVQVEHQENGDRGKENAVVGQNPAPGTRAQTGAKVIIYVGRHGHEGD